ncbi:MAG: ATP-binding protein [Candidatus Sulfopaludibacter sp.]|nr:ATP-binding protein [Candidatus Sulfopaludibacter sp.]
MPANSDAPTELRAALQRTRELLARRFAAQREAGRTAGTDPLRGVAIDEGEVEGILRELAADLTRPPAASPEWVPEAAAEADRQGTETPLRRACRVFRLSLAELDALLLALAVELDPRFARLVAYLNDHVARTRPTIGLALSLSGSDPNAVEFSRRPALRQGLLQVEGDGPLSGLALRVAPEFLPRLGSASALDPVAPGVRLRSSDGPRLEELIAGPAARARLCRWAARLRSGTACPPIVLAGPPGAGRATAAQAASSATGRNLVETLWTPDRTDRADRLGIAAREALWRDATLLVRVAEDGRDPDLAGLWAALSRWELPLALAVPPELIEPACAAAPVEPVVVRFEGNTIEQRDALWKRLLPGGGSGLAVTISDAERMELAARYDFLPGTLARALRSAAADRSGSAEPLDFESLSRACRAAGSAAMGPIAQRLPQPYTRADLVLPRELLDELDLASAWMRNRRRVFEEWSFGRRMILGRGLTALFTGEPGTGKTMAAQVLAGELGLDLFRVDLSRVMSKYIGETEKNLSRLFDDARASGAILFFDEADALFGKRTEVKDAHDRYANLEIGYLLQRMEEHAGTTVLATNRMGDMDEAFTRRFHFILDFPMPRPPERRRIWEGMLPRDAARDAGLDLDKLARDYEISGGEIRNSVLSAAFLAANEGVPIGMRHLKRGLRRELLKTGRVLDSRQRQALDGS